MDSRHKNRLDGVDDQHSSRWNFVLEDSTSLCSSILNSFKRFLMTVVDVVVVERGKGKAGGQALWVSPRCHAVVSRQSGGTTSDGRRPRRPAADRQPAGWPHGRMSPADRWVSDHGVKLRQSQPAASAARLPSSPWLVANPRILIERRYDTERLTGRGTSWHFAYMKIEQLLLSRVYLLVYLYQSA